MQHFSSYRQFNNDFIIKDEYLFENIRNMDEIFQQLDEGFVDYIKNLGSEFLSWLGEQVFPKNLTTEQLIVHYAQLASAIVSLVPGLNLAAVSIEVVLTIYWLYKYNTATTEQSRNEAVSELITGLIIIGINTFMGGGRLIGKSLSKGFKLFLNKKNPLLHMNAAELKSMERVFSVIKPIIKKSKSTLTKILNWFEKYLPSGTKNKILKAVDEFDNFISGVKKGSKVKKGIKTVKTVSKELIDLNKTFGKMFNKVAKNKAADMESVYKLTNKLAKDPKYSTNVINEFLENLAKDKTGGITAIEKLMAKTDSAFLTPSVLNKYKVLYNNKKMSLAVASKEFEKDLVQLNKKGLLSNSKYDVIVNGEKKKLSGKTIAKGMYKLVMLPTKAAKNVIGAALYVPKQFAKFYTRLNRQVIYAIDDNLMDGSITSSVKKELDKVMTRSAEQMSKAPDIVIIRYNQPGERYYEMNWSTNKTNYDVQVNAEFVGLRIEYEELQQSNLLSDYTFESTYNGEKLIYYSILGVNSSPYLKGIQFFALTDASNKNATILATILDKNSKKITVIPFDKFKNVKNAKIVSYDEASNNTQFQYDIIEKKTKEFEEEKKSKQQQIIDLFKTFGFAKRMQQDSRESTRGKFIRDIKDLKKFNTKRTTQKEAA